MQPQMVLLDEAFPLPRPVGEHHHDVTLADELDRSLHRLQVSLAAPNLEGAARPDDWAERPPEQLGLFHEAEVALRPDRQPKRPGIEVRDVVRGEHVPAFLGQILHTTGAQPIQALEEWPQNQAGKEIEGAGPHVAKYLRLAVF